MGAPFQALLMAGITIVPGVLTGLTTNLWGAYSLLRLNASNVYAGSCLRVRRSSDNAEQDIGFVGQAVDSASMLTFVGANNGFVTKWYDQSGGGNDIVNATAANQPLIVDAGVYVGEVEWDGVNDNFVSGNNSGTPTGFSVHVAGRDRAPTQGANSAGGNFYQQVAAGNGAGTESIRFTAVSSTYSSNIGTGTTGLSTILDPLALDNRVYSFVHDRTAGTLATQSVCYINGTLQSSTATGGSLATSTFSAAPWTFGSNSTSANFCRLAASTVLVYETAQSSGTVASIVTVIAPTVTTGVLDGFTTNLWGVFCLRKQVSAFAGSCLRVRRSSDNAEQDIGFSGGFVDTASMLTFVGANNGFITKFYDQSGAANDIVQATAANQPQIVSSGVYLGWIQFDASNDILSSTNNSGTPTAFTLFVKGTMRNMTDCAMIEQSANYNSNNAVLIEPGASANQIQLGLHGTGGGGGVIASRFSVNAVNQVTCYAFDRTATGAAKARMFNGGFLMTRDANGDAGTAPTGNFGASPWNIGARSGGTIAAALNLDTLVIYETAVSDANINNISRLLG